MTEKELFQEVGMIKEEYVTEAEEYKRSVIYNPAFRRILATAACLVLCVGIYRWSQNVNIEENFNSINSISQSAGSALNKDSVQVQLNGIHFGDRNESAVCDEKESQEETAGMYFPNISQKEQVTIAGEVSETVQSSEAENKCEVEVSMKDDISYNLGEVKIRLMNYPDTLEELRQENVYIILDGMADTGMGRWEEFLRNMEEDIPAYIDIVQFAEEEYPIITCLHYDGQLFHVVCDSTRDWLKENEEGIWEKSYKYLNILQSDERTEAVLSQEANLTTKQIQSGEYDIFELFQCNME